jgi:[ribosomal protein S18]-alanine N-acetyltransferase
MSTAATATHYTDPLADGTRLHIRWMVRRDMPEVLAIENACFEFPWSEDDFIRCLRQDNCIGMVADAMPSDDRGSEPNVAYMIYGFPKTKLAMFNFAVAPQWQRRGVGTRMILKMKAKLSTHRRRRIEIRVRDGNLAMQLFLRSQGFRCVNVERSCYDDSDEAAYRFVYRHEGGA